MNVQAVRPFDSSIRIGVSLPFGVANLKAGVPGSDKNEQLRESTPLVAETLATTSRNVERAGLESVWVADVLSRGFSTPDPLVAVAVAATATERIEIGIGVLQVPLREPVDLAHRVLTATLVSGSRLVLGVGAGSTKADFDAVGANFERRGALLTERLQIMQTLWRGERVGDAQLYPWQGTHGGPPLLIGSWAAKERIRGAATDGMGWIASGAMGSWERLERDAHAFRQAGGRRAVLTSVDYRPGPGPSGSGAAEAVSLCCPAEEIVERLRRLRAIGFTDVVVTPPDWQLETLRVLARLRDLAVEPRSRLAPNSSDG